MLKEVEEKKKKICEKMSHKEVAIDVDSTNRNKFASESQDDYDRRKSLGHVTRYTFGMKFELVQGATLEIRSTISEMNNILKLKIYQNEKKMKEVRANFG